MNNDLIFNLYTKNGSKTIIATISRGKIGAQHMRISSLTINVLPPF
jgi:hypothetical protein